MSCGWASQNKELTGGMKPVHESESERETSRFVREEEVHKTMSDQCEQNRGSHFDFKEQV